MISHRILGRYVSSGPEGRVWHLCETARRPDSRRETISVQAKAVVAQYLEFSDSVKAGSITYRTAEQDRTRRLKREGPLGLLVR